MIVVSGAALTKFGRRHDESSFRDWAREAFQTALAMAELDLADIDQLVFASESDFFSLQLNPATLIADDLGLRHVPAIRVEGGGASGQLAVHDGCARISAGLARHVAVVGADPVASQLPGGVVKTLYGFSFDALTDGLTGASSTVLYALSFQDFMQRKSVVESDLTHVTIQNRANACNNPGAHLPRQHTAEDVESSPLIASPYRKLHCSPLSDGASAVILSHKDALPNARSKAARIAGIGSATDRVNLGHRTEPGVFAAKTRAMQRASNMAGIVPSQIGMAEVYDAFAGAQLQALDALGLSENISRDLREGVFAVSGRLPVNLSGGLMGQGAPVGATGIAQTATCALMLEGQYHRASQLPNPPRFALADTHGGICSTAAVTVLERAT